MPEGRSPKLFVGVSLWWSRAGGGLQALWLLPLCLGLAVSEPSEPDEELVGCSFARRKR